MTTSDLKRPRATVRGRQGPRRNRRARLLRRPRDRASARVGRADRRPDQRPPRHHVGAPEADPRGARAARHPL